MKIWSLVVLALMLAAPAAAQPAQPYAGLQNRAVKTLAQEKIDDLRAGRGAGYALAAELNGYPGPAHVLELREQLGLSSEQRRRVEDLFQDMRRAAVLLGERLIAQETALDRLFTDRTATPERLQATTQAIGLTEAALRTTHLKYHLSTRDILTPEQTRRYAELRGYGAGHQPQPHHGHH